MADYHSIITKTISGLSNNTPEVRQAVYAKARTAIENQLRRLSPPPGEEVISAQLKLLEEAIVVVEAENAVPIAMAEPVVQPVIEEPPTVDSIAPAPETETVVAPVAQSEVATDAGTPTTGYSVAASSLGEERKTPKSGAFGKAVMYLLILAVLAGGGYALWLNRGSLEPIFASMFGQTEDNGSGENTQPETEGAETTQETPVETEEPVEKEPVRLGENGEDEVAETPSEEVAAEPNSEEPQTQETEVPVVLDQTPEQPEPEVEPVPENSEEAAPAEPTTTPTLGEVAYLYEEGSAGSGATRSAATVSWTVVRVKPTDALPPEPVIVGNMEIPEKGMTIELNIKRNVDAALSASHIIEVTFDVPQGFSGGEIDNIARFVMKPSEEARGEPLVAVPVKVSEGYFLIALDNLEQAIQVNQQLLTDSGWIDIPISYATGKRALLTLEKGGTGEKAFAEAFNDWKNR